MTSARLAPCLVAVGLIACSPASSPPPTSDGGTLPADASTALPDASTPNDAGAGDGGPLRAPNPIPAENALPGTTAWELTEPSTQHEIEGYALKLSVNAGEAVDVAVNVSQPMAFSWVAYRLGYYGGTGGREVARGGPLSQSPQPACPMEAATGLVACAWPKSLTVQTQPSWVAGIHLLKLVRADGLQAYVPFLVRNDARAPDVLVSVPTNTWAAYNAWGGESLYDDASGTLGGVARKVSLDKPFIESNGAGQLLDYDRFLVQWLEAQGIDVGYASSAELDRDSAWATAPATRVVVLSGHDEYWTRATRDGMDAAVANGKSLLNFGANQGYLQVRLEPAADGRERRTVVCYKDLAKTLDPVGAQSPELTARFRELNRPENALFGVMYNGIWNQFAFPAVVTAPSHWIYAGTGVSAGDTLPLVAGYEMDEVVPNAFSPQGLEVISQSQVHSLYRGVGRAQMVVRQVGPAVVFSAGGIDFVRAISSGATFDGRVERMAANLLYRTLGMATPEPRPVFPRFQIPTTVSAGWKVSTVAGVTGSQGDVDGPAGVGRLLHPTAVGVLPGGELLVVDSSANKLKRVSASGTLSTVGTRVWKKPVGLAVAADGTAYVTEVMGHSLYQVSPDGTTVRIVGTEETPGFVNGPGATALLQAPMGVTLWQGSLYVADQDSGTIRKVELASGTYGVSTFLSGFFRPSGVAFAPDGTIYVVESGRSRIVQKKNGLATFFGGPTGFGDGPVASARILPFMGIAVLPDGTVAVGDSGNYRVRLIRNGATVETAAGSGRAGVQEGSPGDVVLPTGLAVASDGSLLVADTGNGAIRRLTPP